MKMEEKEKNGGKEKLKEEKDEDRGEGVGDVGEWRKRDKE